MKKFIIGVLVLNSISSLFALDIKCRVSNIEGNYKDSSNFSTVNEFEFLNGGELVIADAETYDEKYANGIVLMKDPGWYYVQFNSLDFQNYDGSPKIEYNFSDIKGQNYSDNYRVVINKDEIIFEFDEHEELLEGRSEYFYLNRKTGYFELNAKSSYTDLIKSGTLYASTRINVTGTCR